MPTTFAHLDALKDQLISRLSIYDPVDEGHRYPWLNHVWRSETFRRAHLDIVDVRDTKKLYMMHLTVFPHVTDGSPIFGFDLIAGPNKVTGAFHDFSPIDPDSYLLNWFRDRVASFQWSKERSLPDWARAIFSDNMIAAGNISDEGELETILALVNDTLNYYLGNIGITDGEYFEAQNKYCRYQKQNPHTPKVMMSLGFDKETVHDFIQSCLFPEMP